LGGEAAAGIILVLWPVGAATTGLGCAWSGGAAFVGGIVGFLNRFKLAAFVGPLAAAGFTAEVVDVVAARG